MHVVGRISYSGAREKKFDGAQGRTVVRQKNKSLKALHLREV